MQTPTSAIPPIKTALLLNLNTVKLEITAPIKLETPIKVVFYVAEKELTPPALAMSLKISSGKTLITGIPERLKANMM